MKKVMVEGFYLAHLKKVMEEGFYIAHLRNEDLLCCVYRKGDSFFAALPNGEDWAVSSVPRQWPYILPENLEKTNPEKYAEQALNLIRFIYTNMGRLRENQSQLEAVVKTA